MSIQDLIDQRNKSRKYIELCQALEKLLPSLLLDERQKKIVEEFMEEYNLILNMWKGWEKNEIQIEDIEEE